VASGNPKIDGAQATDAPTGGQERRLGRWTVADYLTLSRIPLAVLFVFAGSNERRLWILAVAGITDLIDGYVARRWGSSRLGPFLDPVADKVFAAAAFGVVMVSGRLHWGEVIAVLARDIATAFAFLATVLFERPSALPARLGGKIVTIGQLLTVLAFLVDSPYLRPIAWATAAIGLYAMWDYMRVRRQKRVL
jgi:CDP-diacylglycerol--glycerol-3-phosphate 3-phosphatidyltransferase/cardiolipin synthase